MSGRTNPFHFRRPAALAGTIAGLLTLACAAPAAHARSFLFLGVGLPGPVVAGPPAPVVPAAVYVEGPPPPPPREAYVAPPPGPRGAAWVPGHWAWRPRGYVWVRGHWVFPPRPGGVWVEGRWVHGPHGWWWREGRWG